MDWLQKWTVNQKSYKQNEMQNNAIYKKNEIHPPKKTLYIFQEYMQI